uniref:Guanine nucleotide-binding protein subunit beta-like protein n=2 Tax=Palpitomonas bilix TaxID=652834 RepID=A0A7S3D1X9_9EUKA|mmetsp:Transcript_18403/g.46212  ORF Transcript_18403/g.46212 Transcript_18403/m.46212 type:complete len:266 (+) Transcript_18403:1055-1852(+)
MFFTGDFNGEIHAWRNGQPSSKRVAGKGHSCVVDMKVSADELVSVGLDDVLRRTKISDSMSYGGAAVKLPGAPTGLAVADDAAIVSSANGLAVVKGDNVVFHYEDPAGVKFNCVAVDSSGKTVAAGSEKGAVVVFDLNGDGSLVIRHTLSLHAAGVCSIAVSTDGAFIASADNKSVFLWDAVDGQIKVKTWQGFHNSLIKSVDFAKDGKRIISASADESVIVWSVDEPDKVQKLSWTHAGGASGAKFLNDSHFVSVGSDACVKIR